jgi:glycosyltransferase involved in cell wall biosynthesis
MDIIVHDPGRYHVSLDTVWEFEEAIHLDDTARIVSSRESPLMHIPNIVWRAAFRLVNALPRAARPTFHSDPMPETFAILMGPNFRKTLPRFFAEGKKSAYLFDAWPQNHEKIRLFADACAIDHLFISSSQGAAALNLLVKSTKCHWVPEGITPSDYYLAFRPEKDIDVLQLGRRYDTYHEMIAADLERRGKKYFYEKVSGTVIFPTRLDYVEGLARTKISICAPLSVSHPTRAGGIETMTVRYLQSMLSRCLIVGHAPAEMIQLFGYNPLIEIDYSDPANQLLKLLDYLPEYQSLIEKNYQAVREYHTWQCRWRQILKILNDGAPAGPAGHGDKMVESK